MEKIVLVEILVIGLLLLGTFVALAMRLLNFPYRVALVLVGLGMMFPQFIEADFMPDLTLPLIFPPLIFVAARRINLDELCQNLRRVLVLSFPGVILTTLIVGGILTFFTQLSLPMALVFGALISTTDPFAIGELPRNFGNTKKLAILVNGESLFSNGIAVVAFNLAIISVLVGRFHFLNNLAEFTLVTVGGMAVGLALGWLIAKLVEPSWSA